MEIAEGHEGIQTLSKRELQKRVELVPEGENSAKKKFPKN